MAPEWDLVVIGGGDEACDEGAVAARTAAAYIDGIRGQARQGAYQA
jgi:thioredoxin reductase